MIFPQLLCQLFILTVVTHKGKYYEKKIVNVVGQKRGKISQHKKKAPVKNKTHAPLRSLIEEEDSLPIKKSLERKSAFIKNPKQPLSLIESITFTEKEIKNCIRCSPDTLNKRSNASSNVATGINKTSPAKRNQSKVYFTNDSNDTHQRLFNLLHNPRPVDTKNINKLGKLYKQAHEGNQSFDNGVLNTASIKESYNAKNTLLNPHPIENQIKILTKITNELDNSDGDKTPKQPPGMRKKEKEKDIPNGHEKDASEKPAGVNYKPDKVKPHTLKTNNQPKEKFIPKGHERPESERPAGVNYKPDKITTTKTSNPKAEKIKTNNLQKNNLSKSVKIKPDELKSVNRKPVNLKPVIVKTNDPKHVKIKTFDLKVVDSKPVNFKKVNEKPTKIKLNIHKLSKLNQGEDKKLNISNQKIKTYNTTKSYKPKPKTTKPHPLALLARIASDMETSDVVTNIVKALGINDILDDSNNTKGNNTGGNIDDVISGEKSLTEGSGDEVSSGNENNFKTTVNATVRMFEKNNKTIKWKNLGSKSSKNRLQVHTQNVIDD